MTTWIKVQQGSGRYDGHGEARGRTDARRPPFPERGRIVIRIAIPLLAAGALGIASTAWAQDARPGSRGELLYSTHCIACHTQQIHWREQRLVTDWASLDAQVRRWSRNAGVAWSDDDVVEVARYLNGLHYRFVPPSVTGAQRADFPPGIARAK